MFDLNIFFFYSNTSLQTTIVVSPPHPPPLLSQHFTPVNQNFLRIIFYSEISC